MNRYFLDTNIVLFFISGDLDDLSVETVHILNDYNYQLYISSIVAVEIVQLFRIGKIKPKKYKTAEALLIAIETDFFIKILPFTKEHTHTTSCTQNRKWSQRSF